MSLLSVSVASMQSCGAAERHRSRSIHVSCLQGVCDFLCEMGASPCCGETLTSVLDGISMSFKSPVKLKRALAFRAVELAVRADRFHEWVVEQSMDVTLPLKEELSVDIPVPRGMEDIVKVVGRLRPFERVQQRTAEWAVFLDPRGRVQQQTAERTMDLPLLPESSVEVARFSPRERVQ